MSHRKRGNDPGRGNSICKGPVVGEIFDELRRDWGGHRRLEEHSEESAGDGVSE